MPVIVPVPQNEQQRLEKLRGYGVLDTPPSEAFDRITRLASRLLKTPIALVSLVDQDRQWFKSKVGLEADETPRELAFCAHAICDSAILVVPDATEDPRFAENPLVTGAPDIRFYAGVPLRTEEGLNMGTLCVIDSTPREFSEEDRALLNDLAQIVIDELELHVLARGERDSHKLLTEAIEAAPGGFVYYDSQDRLVLCNERYKEFYPEAADLFVPGASFEHLLREGVARGQFPAAKGNEEAWIQERLEQHRNPGGPVEHQLPDGRWVRIQERRTQEGGTVGFRTDITELKEREFALEQMAEREHQARKLLYDAIEAAPDAFVYYDHEDRLALCNQRYREFYAESADLIKQGVKFEDGIRFGVQRGQYPAALGNEEAWIADRLESHRNPQGPIEQELPDGRWMRIEERRTEDGGTVGFRTDITELKEREFALEQMAEREQQARKLLYDAIEAAPDGFVYYDAEDRLALCNSRYREFYPYSAEHFQLGTRFEDLVRKSMAKGQFPQAKRNEGAWIQQRLEAHRNPQGPVEQQLPDGRWIRLEERRTQDGGTVGFRTDITELKRREFALEQMAEREQQARKLLYDAVDAAPDGFVYYDAEDRLALCNERYHEFYLDSADLLVPGTSFETILREGLARGQYPEAEANEEAWIEKGMRLHRDPQGPVEQQLPDGRWLRIEERRTRDGGTVGFRTDITELKQRELELERLAATDHLTGAMNRRRFLQASERELRRGRRYGVPLSVLLFDIDRFKQVNDTYGHAAGDEVLRHVVKVAKETLREHDLLCRYGGEEFAVLFPETDSAAAEVAAQRLRVAIEKTKVKTEAGPVNVTASFGGTQIEVHEDSLESALSRADSGLYAAKHDGRNRVVFKASPPHSLCIAE